MRKSREILRTEGCKKMSEMCNKSTTSGPRTCSLIPALYTPVSHTYPTSPWPICHKKKKWGGLWSGLEETLHQLYKTGLTVQGWCTKPALQGTSCWNYTMTCLDVLSDRPFPFFSTHSGLSRADVQSRWAVYKREAFKESQIARKEEVPH